jgi:hypothetical protein
MNRRSIVLATLFCLVPSLALADIAPEALAPLTIVSAGVEASALTYRITNTGRSEVTIGSPRVVLLERGVRVPVRITAVQVDGATVPTTSAIRIAAGRTVTLRVTHEAIASGGEIELSFRGGGEPVEPHRTSRDGRS